MALLQELFTTDPPSEMVKARRCYLAQKARQISRESDLAPMNSGEKGDEVRRACAEADPNLSQAQNKLLLNRTPRLKPGNGSVILANH